MDPNLDPDTKHCFIHVLVQESPTNLILLAAFTVVEAYTVGVLVTFFDQMVVIQAQPPIIHHQQPFFCGLGLQTVSLYALFSSTTFFW